MLISHSESFNIISFNYVTYSPAITLRNLNKLAAVAYKFLKSLVDATGMSFSLLAGSPSAELQGHINVYR
jgi:hypothetical protein